MQIFDANEETSSFVSCCIREIIFHLLPLLRFQNAFIFYVNFSDTENKENLWNAGGANKNFNLKIHFSHIHNETFKCLFILRHSPFSSIQTLLSLINSSLLFSFALIDKMTGVEFYNNRSLPERENFFVHCVRKSWDCILFRWNWWRFFPFALAKLNGCYLLKCIAWKS